MKEVNFIPSIDSVVQEGIANEISWETLVALQKIVSNLGVMLGQLEHNGKQYDAIPLVAEVQGYYYKANREVIDQNRRETDLTEGEDKLIITFDRFIAQFEQMAGKAVCWRGLFSRVKPKAMDALGKMIFIGMTINDDNVSSNDLHDRHRDASKEFYRSKQIADGETYASDQAEQKALGFLIGRKIAKRDRLFVPSEFSTQFAWTYGSNSMDNRVDETKMYKIAEEFYDEWMKVNGQN